MRVGAARQLLDGAFRILLADALIVPTGLLTAAFLSRRLGPEGFGLFTLAATIVAWFEWTVPALFARATIKLVGEADDWRPVGATVVRLHLIGSGAAALLLGLLAWPIAAILDEPVLAGYLCLFVLEVPLVGLAGAHYAILGGVGRFRQQALARAARRIARLVLIALLVGLGLSVPGAILGSIGASLIELAIARLYIRPSLRRPGLPTERLWEYVRPLFLFALSRRLYDKLDLFALQMLGGTAALVGIYAAARTLCLFAGFLAQSFSPLLLATVSRLLSVGDRQGASRIGREAMRAVVLLVPFAGLTAGAAPGIVDLIFGPAFSPAAPLLATLIFGSLGLAMISVATALLVAAGRPGLTFILIGPLLPLAVVGHVLLIPWLGAFGAALVTTLGAGFGAVAAVLAVYRVWRVLPPAGTLWRTALVCGLTYAVAASWPASGIVLLVELFLLALAVPLAFLVLGEFSGDELILIGSLLPWRAAPKERRGER